MVTECLNRVCKYSEESEDESDLFVCTLPRRRINQVGFCSSIEHRNCGICCFWDSNTGECYHTKKIHPPEYVCTSILENT